MHASITVREISSSRDKKAFVRYLWDVYRTDPNWVPPLVMDRLKLIDEEKNPFYQHAKAKWFLAEENGRIVGRLGAIINHSHNELHKEKTGWFGFFECRHSQEVADVLFAKAEAWLRSEGMTQVLGPANPSSNDEFGLLVDGFDRPPVMLMTYNPPYYVELIENAGYRKEKDLYAYLISQKTSRSPKLERVVKALQERSRVTVRAFDPKHFDRDVALIKDLYNHFWEKNWGFVPFTAPEIDFMAKDLKQIYDPEVVLFAERDGQTVGFSLSLPDINQAFAAGTRIPKGAMNLPIGVFSLLSKKKHIDTLRIMVLGVLPELRGRGIDGLLYWETMERALKKGYMFGEASWVLEDNEPMNRAALLMQGERYKTYRIYQKQL
jgi:GNAT superfamily N-acetyltransferase